MAPGQLASSAFKQATNPNPPQRPNLGSADGGAGTSYQGKRNWEPASEPPPPFPPDRFAPADRGKIIGSVILACGVVVAAIIAAYQQAGVLNVLLAHIILVAGWIGFVGSMLLIEHVVSMPTRRKVKVTAVAALIAGVFMFGMDRLMVYLRAQQKTETSSNENSSAQISFSTPSATLTPSPKASATPISTPAVAVATPSTRQLLSQPSAPAYFNGEVSFKGGVSHRLDNILKAAGYDGPMTLETLEWSNPSDVSVCWRVGSAKERCSQPGDSYNFPGGVDAAQVYISAKADAKLDIGLKSR
jgi:hypothetical protein